MATRSISSHGMVSTRSHALSKAIHTSARSLNADISMKRRSTRASSLPLSATTTTPWWNSGAPRVVCRLYQPGRRGYATVVDEQEPGKTAFPFPTHANPTAHEIFHLPRAASQSQIKSRYYELVRLHHPDSHHSRAHLSPDQAQSQFASITAAYDYLRGVSSSHLPNAKRYGYEPGQSNFDPYLHELARRRRAQQASQAHRGQSGSSGSQDWGSWGGAGFAPPRGSRGGEGFNEAGRKERTVLALGVAALVLGLYPSFVLFPFQLKKTHNSAAKNLAKARNDAREMGGERRDGIRKRVQSMQREKQQGLSELEVGAHGKDVHVSPFEGDVRSA